MILLSSFLLGLALLSIEGFLIGSLLLGRSAKLLRLSCSLPLGALGNAFLFYLLHIAGIPIALLGFIVGHLLIIGLLAILLRLQLWKRTEPLPVVPDLHPHWSRLHSILFWLLLIFTGLIIIAFSTRAIVLPTYYWDSFTNWHMRARTMLELQDILFHGVQKPQYPILLHGLQMSVMMINGWNDHAANIATLLLSLSLLLGIGIMARAQGGRISGIVVPSMLIAVPFAMTHLQQGYADIHYTSYLLLSASVLGVALHDSRGINVRMLILSALLCAASAWTKLEGLWLGVVPWLAIVTLIAITRKEARKHAAIAVGILVALIAPWPILLQLQQLPATSHGITFEWNMNAIPLIIKALFMEGSFGVQWYAISVLGLLMLMQSRTAWLPRAWPLSPSTLFGLLTLGIIFGIFLVTIDSQWLQSQITFSRTMLLPTLLLTQGIALTVFERMKTSKTLPL